MLSVAIVEQRVEVHDAFDPDVAASAAVAAIRTTELDKLFAPEPNAAVAAVLDFM